MCFRLATKRQSITKLILILVAVVNDFGQPSGFGCVGDTILFLTQKVEMTYNWCLDAVLGMWSSMPTNQNIFIRSTKTQRCFNVHNKKLYMYTLQHMFMTLELYFSIIYTHVFKASPYMCRSRSLNYLLTTNIHTRSKIIYLPIMDSETHSSI